jgi:hypothetical protein
MDGSERHFDLRIIPQALSISNAILIKPPRFPRKGIARPAKQRFSKVFQPTLSFAVHL